MSKRWLETAVAVFEGLVDVTLCCHFLLRQPITESLLWGVPGGLAFGVLYLVVAIGAASLGIAGTTSDDDAAGQLLDDTLAAADEGEKDPWYIDWPLAALIAIGIALSMVVAVLIGRIRTVITVAAFAFAASDAWWVTIVGVPVAAIGIHLIVSFALVEPYARRRGIEW